MEAHGDGSESSVQVELRGLSIYTHHGVTEAEQEVGQRLVVDVSFDVPDCDTVLTDLVRSGALASRESPVPWPSPIRSASSRSTRSTP